MVEKISDYTSMTKEELIEYFERSLKLKDDNITLKEEKLKTLERSFEELMNKSSFYEFETENLIKFLRKENKQLNNQLEQNLKFSPSNNINILDLSEDLNNKDRITLLLKSEALTSTQLADKLGLSKQDTRTYLLRLKKENKIRVLAKKGRLNIYTAKRPVAIQKQDRKLNDLGYDLSYLMNLIEVKMKLKEGENLTPADTLIITRIKDRILETRVDLLQGKENLREEVNKKIANLEAKINLLTAEGISSQNKRNELFAYQKPFSGKDLLKNIQDILEEKEKLDIFLYNEKYQKYQKYELVEKGKIYELLNPDFTVLFVDPKRYRVWIWHGSNTTTRMKNISAKLAPNIRDRYGKSFKITSVDEGKETAGFKEMISLLKEVDYSETQTRPVYEYTEENLDLLGLFSREKEKALKTIENIMEVESIDEIILRRDYLLEIFDKRILKFSKDDGKPIIIPWVLQYFLKAGITTKIFGNIIQFYRSGIKPKTDFNPFTRLSHFRDLEREKIPCHFCGYVVAKPFPKDFLCPYCGKYLISLYEKPQPKRFETIPGRVSPQLKRKRKIKYKAPNNAFQSDLIELGKGEYIKLLGITSTERTQLYCSNKSLDYLLELTNNLDLFATRVLGGKLEKMLLISRDEKIEEKCHFYEKDEIIYLVYGQIPEKKAKWLLEQISKIYSDIVKGKDFNNLDKYEKRQLDFKFQKRVKFILDEYRKLQDIIMDQEINVVEDTIRIDYIGLSSMSIGVISLLLGDELFTELHMEFESPEEEREMKESMITARLERIAANTQGNMGVIPRWIAVKLGFQKYRFITFKKHQNDYFLYLLLEGNLAHLEGVERLIDEKINKSILKPFSGNLKPFNKSSMDLIRLFRNRRKFPPFNFDYKLKGNKKKEVIELEDVKLEARGHCMYCGSKLTKNEDHCSECGTRLDDMLNI
jgi:hypothetical protein